MIGGFLTNIDLYGKPLYFTIFKDTHHKTSFGGFITILSFTSFMLFILYFGQDFYLRKNPRFIFYYFSSPEYNLYQINNSNFALIIRVEDEDGNLYNSTNYFNISFQYIQGNLNNSKMDLKYSFLDNLDCNLIDNKNLKINGHDNKIMNSTCINLSNINLGGYWDNDFINFISINVNPCDNSTNNNNCKSMNEIIDQITNQNLYVNLYSIERFIDLEDYQQPLKSHLSNEELIISIGHTKIKNMFYKKATVYTDFGLVTTNYNLYSTFSFEQCDTDFTNNVDIRSNDVWKSSLVQYNVYMNYNIDNFSIYFMKLQEFIASLGGLIIISHLFFDTITLYINKHERTLKLVNKLFDFSDFEDNKKLNKIIDEYYNKEDKDDSVNLHNSNRNFLNKSNKELTPREKLQNYSPTVFEINQEIIERPRKRELFTAEKVHALYNDKKSYYKLEMSIFFVLKAFLCEKYLSKKEDFFIKIYEKSKKIINNKLDVVNYLKFYQEYSIVKSIIFNDISNFCLTLLQKPNLHESNTFNKMHLCKVERVKKVFDYFSQKDYYSGNDYKLLNILTNDVKKIINIYKENCYI